MAAQEAAPARAAVVQPAATKAQVTFNPAALTAAAEEGLAGEDVTPPPEALEAAADQAVEAAPVIEEDAPTAPPGELAPERLEAKTAEPIEEELPLAEEVGEVAEELEAEEAPVEFATTAEEAPAATTAAPTVEMRHVRVTSSLDILAELENLRKASTASPVPQQVQRSATRLDLDAILRSSLNSRQEVRRRVEERVGSALTNASRCVVTIQLVDEAGTSVGDVSPVEVELRRGERLRQLALNLTVTLQGE
jgi:hypothetical protein